MSTVSSNTIYTAISFAPVQGFIEKSRKLRDLFGASLILSYLSRRLVERAKELNFEVISPGLLNIKEGMPNRILIKGNTALNRNEVKNTLIYEWGKILDHCRKWVEKQVERDAYHWSQKEEEKGQFKGEWERWKSYAWEVFWGQGITVKAAMEDLETRKLKRDWIAINWVGESSSLSGTDAIAWDGLGQESNRPWEWSRHKESVDQFYAELAYASEGASSTNNDLGKFLDPNERLSIPELVKRLVTRYEDVGKHFGSEFRFDSLSEMVRLPQEDQSGHWTGWFMGDGDKVGDKLKQLAAQPEDTQPLKTFSNAMRQWGSDFKRDFPADLGRVIYAGGDDFLGVMYSKIPDQPIAAHQALQWLMGLNEQWKKHGQNITVSVGFVWAGHSVPQRDVLQHCREAEKRAKNLGRDRVAIRVVFNSGQYVQWTCPWAHLKILDRYQDRVGGKNWTHLYNDWAHLKSRHAIQLREVDKKNNPIDRDLALAMLDLYFDDLGQEIQQAKEKENQWKAIVGDNSDLAIVQWVNDLVQVGWQLCSNT